MEGAETGKDLSTAGEEGEGDLMRLEGEKRTKNIEEGQEKVGEGWKEDKKDLLEGKLITAWGGKSG